MYVSDTGLNRKPKHNRLVNIITISNKLNHDYGLDNEMLLCYMRQSDDKRKSYICIGTEICTLKSPLYDFCIISA